MILRVPDYFMEFSCIADRCKDSCCIGWEIDIDEDTHAYYMNVEGALKERLQKNMYQTKDGDYSFRLKEHGRCPFLNSSNLCDICIELGEEALSEVCTEYPRFAIEYGNVVQKCLSLSCEEVGRLVFEKKTPVEFVEHEVDWEPEDDEWDENWALFLETVANHGFGILQNRSVALPKRVQEFLMFLSSASKAAKFYPQKAISFEEVLQNTQKEINYLTIERKNTYEDFSARIHAFYEMETLDDEWEKVKKEFDTIYQKQNYSEIVDSYITSKDYDETVYEKLMVYFFFRYFMNSFYDFEIVPYAQLTVVFTLVLRDMNALTFYKNGGKISMADYIDNARIFSKEVEHSQDNIAFALQEFLFEEVYSIENLLKQF